MDYVVEIDTAAPAKRLVTAKTRAQALQFVADGIIEVRAATSADIYDMARSGIEREDANAAEAAQATLRG